MEILIKGRLWKSQNSISLWNPFCSFLGSQIGYRTPSRAILSLSQTYSRFPSLHRCSSSGGRRYNRGAGIKKQTNKQTTLCYVCLTIYSNPPENRTAKHGFGNWIHRARLRQLVQSENHTLHKCRSLHYCGQWHMNTIYATFIIASLTLPLIYIQTWLKLFSNTLLNLHNSSLLIQITVKWQPFPIVVPTPAQEFSQKAYLQIKKERKCAIFPFACSAISFFFFCVSCRVSRGCQLQRRPAPFKSIMEQLATPIHCQ